WLGVTIDNRMPSADGPEHPPTRQHSNVVLDPVFFVRRMECREQCDPSWFNEIEFTTGVNVSTFARALSVRDVSDPAREQAVLPSSAVKSTGFDRRFGYAVEDAGYDRQPPARTWAYRLDPALQAADGQTL